MEMKLCSKDICRIFFRILSGKNILKQPPRKLIFQKNILQFYSKGNSAAHAVPLGYSGHTAKSSV